MMGGGMMGGGMMGGGMFGRNQQNQSIKDELLDGTLSARQLTQLDQSSSESGEGGEVAASDVSRNSQREQTIYVTLNRSHNLVIVRTGDQDAMAAIEQLINEIDRPTPQVLLEMKIVEITLDDSYRSIFDFQFVDGVQGPTAGDQTVRNPFLQTAATAAENVMGVGNFPVEGGTFVYQFLNDNIRARMELLQTNGNIETVATPLLLASNNRSARIFVGEESLLVRSVSSNVTIGGLGNGEFTSVTPITELVDVGTNLYIVPKINADRTVTLVINQDNSTVNKDGASIPVTGPNGSVTSFPVDTIDTASVSGTVVAKDGLTVAIGGLIRETTIDNVQKVPGLGDLPLVGAAFRKTIQEKKKTELVLLVTPHVITTPLEGQQRSLERVNALSGAVETRSHLQPQENNIGPNEPWSPKRLQEGYQGQLGEDTGYQPIGK
jgi:general secretion pathway protein D